MDSQSGHAPQLRQIHPLPPFASYPLLNKETLVSPDQSKSILPVRRFTFAYPPDRSLGFNLTMDYLKVVRPGPYKPRSYSPTSESDLAGSFELTVKIYPSGTSEWLDSVPIGARVPMIGPLPLPIKKKVYTPGKHVIIVALGIGITYAYAVARDEVRKRKDGTVILIQSVRYRDEIILEEEVKLLSESYPDKFSVQRVASKEVIQGWAHGRVDEELVRQLVGEHDGDEMRFLVVGTKGMMKSMWSMLEGLGYSRKRHALVRKRFQ